MIPPVMRFLPTWIRSGHAMSRQDSFRSFLIEYICLPFAMFGLINKSFSMFPASLLSSLLFFGKRHLQTRKPKQAATVVDRHLKRSTCCHSSICCCFSCFVHPKEFALVVVLFEEKDRHVSGV